jgi:hypothetical protein
MEVRQGVQVNPLDPHLSRPVGDVAVELLLRLLHSPHA